MSSLPDDFCSLLTSPRLAADVKNPEAAALYSTDVDAYHLLAAHSVGRPLPTWSPSTHAIYPRTVRSALHALLLALRVRERRASKALRNGDAAPLALQWPAYQTLPDEVIGRIFHVFARDQLHSLCRRYLRCDVGELIS